MHEVLVNRLGGLSLPRKSVVRLTDHPDMTLDVYRGRKTAMQQIITSRLISVMILRGMGTLPGKAFLPHLFFPPFSVGVNFLRKDLLLLENFFFFTQLHSEWQTLYGVLAILSAIGLRVDCFFDGFSHQGKQTESQKSCFPLYK